MDDIEVLRVRFLRSVEAWNALDVDGIVESGAGNGFGYRVRDARSTAEESPDESRRRLQAVVDTYEYFRIRDVDWHATVSGDVAVAWGFFTEEFRQKGMPPEETRVRFSVVHQRQDGVWKRIWEHRDAQPFDSEGRYLRRSSRK